MRFVGSGDARGSDGRFQTCPVIDAPPTRFAVDSVASSLIAPARHGIHHNSLDAIVPTHLHGDHCGGVPCLLMDAPLGAVGADLLIAECHHHAEPVRWHLNHPAIVDRARGAGGRRVILTHMSDEMLAHRAAIPAECAEAGMVLTL